MACWTRVASALKNPGPARAVPPPPAQPKCQPRRRATPGPRGSSASSTLGTSNTRSRPSAPKSILKNPNIGAAAHSPGTHHRPSTVDHRSPGSTDSEPLLFSLRVPRLPSSSSLDELPLDVTVTLDRAGLSVSAPDPDPAPEPGPLIHWRRPVFDVLDVSMPVFSTPIPMSSFPFFLMGLKRDRCA